MQTLRLHFLKTFSLLCLLTVISQGTTPGIVFSAPLGCSTPSFTTIPPMDTGSLAAGAVSADFNRDGKPDVALIDRSTGAVRILLGNGDGSFQIGGVYTTGTLPRTIATGDFNGDGKIDVVTGSSNAFSPAGGSGILSILIGNGDGTFQNASLLKDVGNPISIAVGDFNRDGKADLAFASESGPVLVLLGNGDGTFKPGTAYPAGVGPVQVKTAALKGDGVLDLMVVSLMESSVSVLIGNGDGTFNPEVKYSIGPSAVNSNRSLALGDFDRDGKEDLAVANLSLGNIAVLLGNGDGTFQSAVFYPVGGSLFSIVSSDFNGDGALDLAVTNPDASSLSILPGRGDGSFQAAVNLSTDAYPTLLLSEDVNGDGKPDLIIKTGPSNSSILLNACSGCPSIAIAPQTLSTGSVGTAYSQTLNASGGLPPYNFTVSSGTLPPGLSLSTAGMLSGGPTGGGPFQFTVKATDANQCSGNVSYTLNLGGAGICTTTEFTLGPAYPVGNTPVAIATGDFNEDGIVDLVVANRFSSDVSILLGKGDGTFQPAVNYSTTFYAEDVKVGDFNHDGKLDLAVANRNSKSVSILLGRGDGTFQAPVRYAVGDTPVSIAVGDFNRDGHPDLAVANFNSNNLSLLFGNGDGTFKPVVNHALAANALSVVAGDLNRDGKLDLAVSLRAIPGISILLGNGDGTFAAPGSYGLWADQAMLALGDFNADGRTDIATVGSNGLAILQGRGDGSFQDTRTSLTGGSGFVGVGDFNGDGRPDLALASSPNPLSAGHNGSVFLGLGDGTFGPHEIFSGFNSPNTLGIGDFNGDGKPDLAVADFYGNTVTVLLNSCLSLRSTLNLVLTGGGSSVTSTAGGSGLKAGYATVSTDSSAQAPYGTAVYRYEKNGVVVSEAGIPASPPTTAARILMEFRDNVATKSTRADAGAISINTGIAIVNRGNSIAHLGFQLRDRAGVPVAAGSATLLLNEHRALFIDQLSQWATDFSVPADFASTIQYGSLDIASDQPVSVVALRLTTNQRGESLITTTAIVDLNKPLPPSQLFFPHIVDGGGYTTTLALMNTADTLETGVLSFLGDDGVGWSVGQMGGPSDSFFRYQIEPNGLFVFQTDGSAATVRAGWAQVTRDSFTSKAVPAGAGIFSFSQGGVLVTESGIPTADVTNHARIYVDRSGGHDTGVAIAFPSQSSPGGGGIIVAVTAFQTDGTTPVGNGPVHMNLNADGHDAKFAGQLISGLPNGFTGVLDISSSNPLNGFVALTLRSLLNTRGEFLLTTFPVADFSRPAPAPIVFPQIADGGGYRTEFILINPLGSALNTTISFLGDDGSPLTVGSSSK
ncbi:MAG: FG-GAP-like repeat-containing protein [Acidobacteriia bacterium]|nr:FG-GAP-like repeat-containing protein [Terriglobia bacterium]